MAQAQGDLDFKPPREVEAESEQDREERLHRVLLRHVEDAADEVGRKEICYALNITEKLLSKQLREDDDKRPSYKLLAYLVKHQKSGRLARWLMTDYAGFLPPQKPDLLEADDFARQIAAMALAGQFGSAEREKVLQLYSRTKLARAGER